MATHRTKDTYPLSHFRQHTAEHLDRLAKGRIEVITQNGEAAMVVMSPESYDTLCIELERSRRENLNRSKFGETNQESQRQSSENGRNTKA